MVQLGLLQSILTRRVCVTTCSKDDLVSRQTPILRNLLTAARPPQCQSRCTRSWGRRRPPPSAPRHTRTPHPPPAGRQADRRAGGDLSYQLADRATWVTCGSSCSSLGTGTAQGGKKQRRPRLYICGRLSARLGGSQPGTATHLAAGLQLFLHAGQGTERGHQRVACPHALQGVAQREQGGRLWGAAAGRGFTCNCWKGRAVGSLNPSWAACRLLQQHSLVCTGGAPHQLAAHAARHRRLNLVVAAQGSGWPKGSPRLIFSALSQQKKHKCPSP